VIEQNPNYAAAWFYKGLVLNALGRNAEAQGCFETAKELGYMG
jgi:tetratricopeptide (TPR) repeat protein